MKRKNKGKRWWCSVIEECVMNPEFQQFRGGRIECFDQWSDSPYNVYEARWLVPCEIADTFRDLFDFKEFDDLPYINFNYEINKEDK